MVAKAIDVLDRVAGDADFEPSLGAPNPTFPSPDVHPAIWAVNRGITQTRWGGGARDDREDEHDGRELQ